jgi:hypothetical protein
VDGFGSSVVLGKAEDFELVDDIFIANFVPHDDPS